MITEENEIVKQELKIYEQLNKKVWGMARLLPYYIDTLTPVERFDLMESLDRLKDELEAEGEI